MSPAPIDRRGFLSLTGGAFVCTLAVSDPSGTIVAEAEGRCRGRITRELRGPGGFGYDPLFLILEYHKTFGELGALAKHQLSHRARAFARVRPLIGMGGDKLLRRLAGLDSEQGEGRRIAADRAAIFTAEFLPSLQPTPGARPMSEWLKREGAALHRFGT